MSDPRIVDGYFQFLSLNERGALWNEYEGDRSVMKEDSFEVKPSFSAWCAARLHDARKVNKGSMSTPKELSLALNSLMVKYSNYGACDSEGYHAINQMEEAILCGKKFPLTGHNPFQLYDSVPGWEFASQELVKAANRYWRAALIENLGLAMEMS